MIGDIWGIKRPFEVAFCSFLIGTAYVWLALPHIPSESVSGNTKPGVKGVGGFFAPLKVLAPQRVVLQSGVMVKHFGVTILCAGVFLGVVSI